MSQSTSANKRGQPHKLAVKIIRFDRGITQIYLIAIAIVCVAATWYFIKWNFADLVAYGMDTNQPELKVVTDLLVQTAPDDPLTHLAAARMYEKTFDPADLARSLSEYEAVAGLAPNSFSLWLELGRAYDRSGEDAKAEAAFRRALDLAPNYSVVQWAFGNSLVRHRKTDEGFALIAKAAASDPQYSNPAAATALPMFDGDVASVRRVLGDTPETNAALASVLAAQQKFDDAADAWSKLSPDDRRIRFKPIGDKLIEKLAAEKKFQLAARVTADMAPDGSEKPMTGSVSNGGFENEVKLRNAGLFEWRIAEGQSPQIGLSESEKHSGKHSLLLGFNSTEVAAFRSVSQTVPVVPGAAYELEIFYRSDLKTTATFKWEIADAATGTAIASTPAIAYAADWTTLKGRFTVPANIDGVVIRLTREGCGAGSCPVNGKLSFDDISIKRL